MLFPKIKPVRKRKQVTTIREKQIVRRLSQSKDHSTPKVRVNSSSSSLQTSSEFARNTVSSFNLLSKHQLAAPRATARKPRVLS